MKRRVSARWLAPLVAAVVACGAGAAVSVVNSAASADLAPRSAASLLTDVAQARVHGLSGTIAEHADLGLPALPGLGAGSDSNTSLSSLLSGSHTLRLWYAGPRRVRLALLGDGGESDLVRNGRSLWLWSSSEKSATHWTLPARPRFGPRSGAHPWPHALPHAWPGRGPHSGPHPWARSGTHPWAHPGRHSSPHSGPFLGHDPAGPLAGMGRLTPQGAAEAALRAVAPSTRVTSRRTTVVAGRPAYLLSLTPRSADTLVRSVQIAIDAATHVPTRVQVFAKGHTDPVFEVGFTSFDPTVPAASRFAFDPPPGTKVTQKSVPSRTHSAAGRPHTSGRAGHSHSHPTVVGSGWSSVVVLPAAAPRPTAGPTAGSTGRDSLSALLAKLPTVSGSWGSGRLLRGTLFSALLTDDGRVAVGAVPPRVLYAALARK